MPIKRVRKRFALQPSARMPFPGHTSCTRTPQLSRARREAEKAVWFPTILELLHQWISTPAQSPEGSQFNAN